MIGEFAGLGLVVASVVVRAAQPALADGLDTAGAAAGPLQALLGKPETTGQFKNKIARQLETSIDRQYRYAASDDRLQAAKAVTRLFGSECLTAEDLVVEAVKDTDGFVSLVMAHGGDQERIGLAGLTTDTTDMRLLMFDGMLRLCAQTLSEAARGSSLFHFIATRRQLQVMDQTANDTAWIRDFLNDVIGPLVSWRGQAVRETGPWIEGARPQLAAGFVARDEMQRLREALTGGGVATVCALQGMRGGR